MKINGYSYDNGFCRFVNQNIDLSRYGIYLIHGENGTGKTVFLKQIVFGDAGDITFNTEKQKQAYIKDRSTLFSYVPQEIPSPYGVNTWEYISKRNKAISKREARQYLDKFGMDDISMDGMVEKLSGGERVKLCIISALLKDTPYIFLDEPSNNLDDESTEYLKRILEDYGEEHTVVVVTHDPRLSFDDFTEIYFTDSISQNDGGHGEINMRLPQKRIRRNVFLMGFSFQNTITNWIAYGLTALLLAGIFFLNLYQFVSGYSLKSNLSSNAILIYQADYVYDDLNQTYAKAKNLEIENDKLYSMIEYEDIPAIADTEGIEQVFLLDEEKLDECVTALNLGALEDESAYTLSIPSIVYENFIDTVGLAELFVLDSGTEPSDGEKEICMSEELYQELLSLGENPTIGESISMNGEEYILAGITLYNIFWISYDTDSADSDLFYLYDENTYGDFADRNLLMKEEQDYSYMTEADGILVITADGSEGEILDNLMTEYPADNYFSSEYDAVWVQAYNRPFLLRLLATNVFLILAVGIFWYLLRRKTFSDEAYKLADYGNYYIHSHRLNIIYFCSYIFLAAAVFLVEWLVFYYVCGNDYRACAWLIGLDVIAMILIQFVSVYKNMQIRRKR